MNTDRSVFGATSVPVYRLNSRFTHMDHAEDSMTRSTEPWGGWKRKALSPPNSSSSVFAYLSRMGVSASGKEAANGPSVAMRTQSISKARSARHVGVWVCGWVPRSQNLEVLCPSRCLDRSIFQPPPCFRTSVWPRRSLRMQPTRSGGISESSERAAASRRTLRLAAGVPVCAASFSLVIAATLAFWTSSHSSHPPTRFSYICWVFDAFSACPRRLISWVSGLGSMLSTSASGSKLA
mmetsp:Transcript_25615/g.58294  ORF Transcript_25615/g.58294 Transcript_25615/m.58294 type:complete len:237 (-) Transcript_25615:1238-1948(-)